MIERIKHIAVLVAASAALSGCGLLQQDMFTASFWDLGLLSSQNIQAELGIAEMAKGNYITAEGRFKNALRTNPKDINALIGAGILYQNTGQSTRAREMYEAVLALRPDESQQFVVWNSITTRPVVQIASVNLSLLDSGGVPSSMGAGSTGGAPSLMAAPQPAVTSASTTNAMLGRTAIPSAESMPDVSAIGVFGDADSSIISRFTTLRALRDQGLITQDEFTSRRRTNIGALLPLTSPPPAAGLDRPVPSPEQISGRLRAIGRALELRAISVSQHSAERSMILDALMPSAPVVIAQPEVPPNGLMEAADDVRRLEKLRDAGFISSDEYSLERQAIEQAMRPPAPKRALAKPAGKVEKSGARPSGPQPAVHLASYRSNKQASRGWAQIKQTHKKVLSNLDHRITKVNLGKKGIYYRLKAGPLESNAEAKAICRKLKRRRQFCEPSVMESG